MTCLSAQDQHSRVHPDFMFPRILLAGQLPTSGEPFAVICHCSLPLRRYSIPPENAECAFHPLPACFPLAHRGFGAAPGLKALHRPQRPTVPQQQRYGSVAAGRAPRTPIHSRKPRRSAERFWGWGTRIWGWGWRLQLHSLSKSKCLRPVRATLEQTNTLRGCRFLTKDVF